MHRKLYSTVSVLLVGLIVQAQSIKTAQVISDAEKQTEVMLKNVAEAKGSSTDLVSPRTLVNGALKLVLAKDWTSGFFAGELWMLYDYTRKPEWKSKAEEFTTLEEKE